MHFHKNMDHPYVHPKFIHTYLNDPKELVELSENPSVLFANIWFCYYS